MNLSEREFEIVKQAVQLVQKRKRRVGALSGAESALVNVLKMTARDKGDKQLVGYWYNQIIAAIALPLARMYFLSHSSYGNINIVEDLAEWLENNSCDVATCLT